MSTGIYYSNAYSNTSGIARSIEFGNLCSLPVDVYSRVPGSRAPFSRSRGSGKGLSNHRTSLAFWLNGWCRQQQPNITGTRLFQPTRTLHSHTLPSWTMYTSGTASARNLKQEPTSLGRNFCFGGSRSTLTKAPATSPPKHTGKSSLSLGAAFLHHDNGSKSWSC